PPKFRAMAACRSNSLFKGTFPFFRSLNGKGVVNLALIDELASIWAEIQKKMIDSYIHLKEILHCAFSPLE
ncbi:unnamed protein product, partial [marine sediment metagenome]